VNRRTYLKGFLAFGAVSLSSFSFFKWIELHKPVQVAELWGKSDLIAGIAEMIIPRTDTPGAKDVNVQQYIINVIINCNTPVEQHKFYTGLEDLTNYARHNFGCDFLMCSADEKKNVITGC
jgi:hypothetical protein